MRRLLSLIIAASLLAACTTASASGPPVHRLDEPLPLLEGDDLEGRPLSSSEFAGSVLVVNAWSTTCKPCEDETPMLVGLSERYADDGVAFLGIDHVDFVADAQRFVERYEVPYPSFADQAGRFAAVLGYPGLPATYVVDAGGTIRYAVLGPVTEEVLVPLIDEVLAAGASPTPSAA